MKTEETFSILGALHRAVHAVQEAVSASDLDVTHPEAVMLAHLTTLGPATMGELHRAFGFRKSTVTNVVDRLVARGLAVRRQDDADGRSRHVKLTAAGNRSAKAVCKIFGEIERRAGAAGIEPVRLVAALDALAGEER